MEYTQYRKIPKDYLERKITEFLAEDIPNQDKTTVGTISPNSKATAIIQAEENIIFAGEPIIKAFFKKGFKLVLLFNDGSFVKKGGIIAKLSGSSSVILSRERVLLNLLQRLCGIATLTNEYTKIANPYNVKILDTRKTTPGLRLFEKYAVTVGGGYNHRLDLSSGILIKDNHIMASGGITKTVQKIKKMNYKLPVEVEVENLIQVKQALEAGVDGLLLDNMPPETIKNIVKFIRSQYDGKKIFIEASGGITLKNLKFYVKTGVDAISVGALTHSAIASNIHMEFI